MSFFKPKIIEILDSSIFNTLYESYLETTMTPHDVVYETDPLTIRVKNLYMICENAIYSQQYLNIEDDNDVDEPELKKVNVPSLYDLSQYDIDYIASPLT